MEFLINYYAVAGAAVASFALGMAWYSPFLFGKKWMMLMGFTPESMKSMKMTPLKSMSIMFVFTLLTSYVLAHYILVWKVVAEKEGGMTLLNSFESALFLWAGFMLPLTLGAVLWENKSWALVSINASFYLVSTMLMSGILFSFS
jgi:hypothetical protein